MAATSQSAHIAPTLAALDLLTDPTSLDGIIAGLESRLAILKRFKSEFIQKEAQCSPIPPKQGGTTKRSARLHVFNPTDDQEDDTEYDTDLETKPKPKPSSPSQGAHPSAQGQANREKLVQYIAANGPTSCTVLATLLDMTEGGIRYLIKDHPWFALEGGRVTITNAARQEVVKKDDA